jgi:(2S)-methylsuccinyl-CoA dehydrogenase
MQGDRPAPTMLDRSSPLLADLAERTADVSAGLDRLLETARSHVRRLVSPQGELSAERLELHQHAVHGLAWLATYCETLRALSQYAWRLAGEGRLRELEGLMVQSAFGEYLSQIAGGIPMNQGEFVRLAELGVSRTEALRLSDGAAADFLAQGSTPDVRARIVEQMRGRRSSATFEDCGLDDTLDQMRGEMRRFADSRIAPIAHDLHRRNGYVPMELIDELADLGVFALTLPEEYGGLGLGKVAMCVVSEELSRGWLAVGSVGTRAEIASELILHGGTDAQKKKWLPAIASGALVPTAVFTEPDTGSDLASLTTRAVRDRDGYRITGNKTWITHPVRADVMTLLARTGSSQSGHKGLSMFIAGKPRGSEDDPFPVAGMSGTEIEVLGYRGLKEYEIRFDDFAVPADSLLGGIEGQGFRQLMHTFESARIQTAARAIGVAQNALELALAYAETRSQFGKPIVSYPRIADKLTFMAVEIMAARQLTYRAAREKDAGRRCDLEAGMAKLLAARVAWAAADNALQIHGGNGFALEYEISRVLCDARILSIFEGAAEIQSQVIARRLLEHGD